MKIAFDISDSEMDIIAEQYAYDPNNGSKEDFVLEQFKNFGRTAILGKVDRQFEGTKSQEKEFVVETAKDSISF